MTKTKMSSNKANPYDEPSNKSLVFSLK